tara:strand:+ start:1142 stop:1405 length:264 start_codon:yes stop_codon:yes gene_type:complete
MTRLSKKSEEAKHIYCEVKEISSIAVDGNSTHMQIEVPIIIDELGRTHVSKTVIVEIPTLDLIQTFNATWMNHAVGKLKSWLNNVIK